MLFFLFWFIFVLIGVPLLLWGILGSSRSKHWHFSSVLIWIFWAVLQEVLVQLLHAWVVDFYGIINGVISEMWVISCVYVLGLCLWLECDLESDCFLWLNEHSVKSNDVLHIEQV